jgi:hypothetical protein
MSGICLAKAPLTLSLSLQARLGELASQRGRIRERVRLGEGTLLQRALPDSLSFWGEDRGSFPFSPWGEGWGEGGFAA